MAHDTRRPVLLLRSFLDDKIRIWRRFRWRLLPSMSMHMRFEQVVLERLRTAGPLIGIGDPREGVPQFGAARAYLSDAAWQTAITNWMDSARVIALIAGKTEWVRWEIRQLLDRDLVSKLILYIPPLPPKERQERWSHTVGTFDGSAWQPALRNLEIGDVLAVLPRPGGEIVALRSCGSMARDYAIASMIALYLLLADEHTATGEIEAAASGAELSTRHSLPTARIGKNLKAAAAIAVGITVIVIGFLQVPQIKNNLFSSEQDLVRQIEQMIDADAEETRFLAIIKRGWPEDYAAILQVMIQAIKESRGNEAALRATISKEMVPWRRKNGGLALLADDAALQITLDTTVSFYRRLRQTSPDLCGRWAGSIDPFNDRTINRELASHPRAEAQAIMAALRLQGRAIIVAIDSGRHEPQQRPVTSPADLAAWGQQIAARGITTADMDALNKGSLPRPLHTRMRWACTDSEAMSP